MEEADKNTQVQQRIKKMLEQRRKSVNRESAELGKRLKSNFNDKLNDDEEDKAKPQSSLRQRRPASALRAADSAKTIAPDTPPPRDLDLRPIIATLFDHSPRLRDFLQERGLNGERTRGALVENELFLVATQARLKGEAEEKYNLLVEREIMGRLERNLQVEEQTRRCEESEARIGKLLEERLRLLGKPTQL
jgi:hypothetical protein